MCVAFIGPLRSRAAGLAPWSARFARSGQNGYLDSMVTSAASSAPPASELESVTASEAKGSFGAVLHRVVTRGAVAITKHEQIRAVLLPVEQYEALLAQRKNPLAELEGEFDSLVMGMQTPKARAAGRALFDASPERLGHAAIARRRRRA